MLTEQPDPDSIILSVIFIIILVLFSGYFSATETAFTSVNRTKLKLKAQDGNKAAKNALYLLDRYDKVISAILVGNNLVNITLSVLFNNLFETVIPNAAVSGIVSVAVSTVIVLTFGEMSPKMIAKENSEKISMAFGYPMRAIMVILYPITILFAGLKFLLRKIFKSKNDDKITEEELLSMVEEAQEDGSLDMQERELISSAIEFDDAEVEDIFVPRVNVIAVPIDMPMEKIKALFLEHNFSRMPVYKNTIDSIVGMIHNIDFFTALEKGENSIKNYITPVTIATEHMKISTLLKSMQRQKVHMAVVVDEYGGTLGIVTMEDLIEEIVGEIYDEDEDIEKEYTKLRENCYFVNGDMEVEELAELVDRNDLINDTESLTVGGFIFEKMGRFPKEGEELELEGLRFEIYKVEDRRIISIIVKVDPSYDIKEE